MQTNPSKTARTLTHWVAISLLLASASVLRAENAGNLRYSISVGKFENEAGWSGRWDLGNGFASIMTDALQSSQQFIVLGDKEMRDMAMDEQDLATTGRTAGGKKAAKTGRLTPAQLLVRGSITHVQDSTTGGGAGLTFKGIRVGGSSDKAEINITIYLVDTTTGQVKASTKVVGVSGRKGLGVGYSGSQLGGLGGDMEGFRKDNVGKASENAVVQAVEFLVKQLSDIPWEASIVLVKPDSVVLNRGEREGVAVGQRFSVGTAEELIDPDTGETLDSEVTTVGEIEVTTVKEKIAYAKPLSGIEKMTKGMTAVPAK